MLPSSLASAIILALTSSVTAASINRLRARDILPGEAILDTLDSWSWPEPGQSCAADKIPPDTGLERAYIPRSWFGGKGISDPCGQVIQIMYEGKGKTFIVVGPDEDVSGPMDDPHIIVSPDAYKDVFKLGPNDDVKARWTMWKWGDTPGGVTSAPPEPTTTTLDVTTTVVATSFANITETVTFTDTRAWVSFSDATAAAAAATGSTKRDVVEADSVAKRQLGAAAVNVTETYKSLYASADVIASALAASTTFAPSKPRSLFKRDHLPGSNLVDIMTTFDDYPQQSSCEKDQLWVKDDSVAYAYIPDQYVFPKGETSPCGHMIQPFNTGRGRSFMVLGKSSDVLDKDVPDREQRIVIQKDIFKEVYDPTGDQAGKYQVNWLMYRAGGSPPTLDTGKPQGETITVTNMHTDVASTEVVSSVVATANVTVTEEYTTTVVSTHHEGETEGAAASTPTPTPAAPGSDDVFYTTLAQGQGVADASSSSAAAQVTAIGG